MEQRAKGIIAVRTRQAITMQTFATGRHTTMKLLSIIRGFTLLHVLRVQRGKTKEGCQ